MKQNLVVIGAGMASGRMLEHLLNADPKAYDITLFNAEPRGNYNRLMLSPVLSGEKTYAEIVTHDEDWYADNGITCRFGEKVHAIDPTQKVVRGEKGDVAYDKLVIATGSNPFMIPLPGHDLAGVIPYRDLEDTEAMMALGDTPGTKAVVIGGGLLGLEAAAGMAARGVDVTVVHIMGHLMERQLDEAAGYLLRKSLVEKGIKVLCKANSKEILDDGTGHVKALRLEDGTELPCDLLVMAVGIRPNMALAEATGLSCNRGVVVDDHMVTSDPDILALGECVEHDGALFGLVAPLYDQAKVLAQTLLGQEARFVNKEVSTKLKVTGCDLFSAGDFAEGEGREDIVFRDPARGVYKRLVLEGDRLIGAVMYGDTADGAWFYSQIKDGSDIAEMRDTLIFGPAYQGGASADPLSAVAALPDDAEICGCNGVCKGDIVSAIHDGATDLGALRACTKASASCGTCTGLVEQVLAVTLGDDYAAPTAQPICGCCDLTHEDVRRLIKSQELKSQAAVWQELGWKTPNGCHVCRPAVNFYLLADWPVEYQDDPQSRFVNERKHANIQKDGTFSVVPRMWGGMTTPDELRAIADAAEKYNVPTVHVTGGQRIDLLGVKGEDLPHIWADLNKAGMVSGHAYAKGLRTVKTCVGKDHCRFGTQDSTGLGIKLEKRLWGSWSPHKVKLAVSGCPRNCAEATCKDIGVVCVDSGYQIGVAGAAGMDVKETERLADVATEEEALDLATAFMQLYRENAKYLDRPYKWVAKVGLDWVKARVVDDLEERQRLIDAFELSQTIYRKDPWAKEVEEKSAAYAPLADLTLEAAE
ncbi:nitrite reductase large subunit NirB [Phaeobacter gallaeciensis]|uniref:nitrite reductase large subunit NirB n=1 Tax=Phaeobacter gallaeciensis TaxID=60890 RepID=UPI00237F0058|nr:nitrite reductase large subunit NirB [Phaeobacter gallaeciensis]MDE4302131.1 nitrite reductase large subunit NirB [Phaeobacter gallaeciensis]MDE4306892.1 nitrite reductase large subunit NirB [Phaeobacter gallaeciensis]MDE4310989.1 nitrite reductase large subunit NirB [Phaeobacter gallaeciensis]MDE4315452.1 nitrite reductase large subunit NirB [Phaeobacter gallaeciensis]MDE4319916.1 nitrite reductase large subunit NirB [Phaeobacter gallaeciensis]